MANMTFRQRVKQLANALRSNLTFAPPGPRAVSPAIAAPTRSYSIQPGSEMAMNGLYGTDQPSAGDSPSSVGSSNAMPETQHVSSARVQQYMLSQINPIRNLNPRRLTTALENFDYGYLREASLIWDKVRDRDDQVKTVAEKRELKPTDMPWEIICIDQTPEAEAHKKALEEFYDNCTVTHSTEQNRRGGVQLLIQQMLRAVGDKYSVHEIIWQPQPGLLTAEFRFVPLWFFEARTGKLRFLPFEGATTGLNLEPAGWVVHSGPGLFVASCIAYLYKQLALKSWVNYNDKFGMPFLHGQTSAAFGSQEWEAMLQAMQNFSSDGALLTSIGAQIEAVKVAAGNGIPMENLCDRMDRALARIWNGGDLSSMSRDAAVGSNPQGMGQDDIAKSDAERLSETMQAYVDRWVIKYKFGVDNPRAKFVLQPPDDPNIEQQMKVLELLVGLCPSGTFGLNDILERFGWSKAGPGDETIDNPGEKMLAQVDQNEQQIGDTNGQPKPIAAPGSESGKAMANVSFAKRKQYNVTATQVVADDVAKTLAPIRARIAQAGKIQDHDMRIIAMQKIVDDLPRFLKQNAADETLVRTIGEAMSTALVAGAGTAALQTNGHRH